MYVKLLMQINKNITGESKLTILDEILTAF